MKQKLRILVLEDSEDDFQLLVRHVKKGWKSVDAKRVETSEEFEQSLEENWDAILSDNTLPNFSGVEALAKLRKKDKITPFIIVSGTIGEEMAVKAMKNGANDYILKADYSRLLPALKREITEFGQKKERLRIEAKLAKSREQYELLANNIQDLVILHEPDSTCIWVSPSVERIAGYKPEEMIGKRYLDFAHEDDYDPSSFEIPVEKMDPNTILRYNYRLRRADNQYINVETVLKPAYSKDHSTQVVSTTRDVTEQKVAYNLLAESEERYYSVINSIREGVILYNSEGNIIAYNHSAAVLIHPSSSSSELHESLSQNYKLITPNYERFPPEDTPASITLKTGEPCTDVVMGLINKTSNEITWVSVNSVTFQEPDGKTGVVVTASDITNQKEAEEKISNAVTELERLIDTANAPIFGIDWFGRINEWNQVCEQITGFGKEEVMGKALIDEFILDGYKAKVTDLLKSALRGKSVTNYELPIRTRQGLIVTILFNATARKDLNGKVIGAIGVGQDITELIQYRDKLEQRVAERTEKLNEALKKEKELVAMKSKFVSMASHEFRTPLSTISFASDFLTRYHNRISQAEIDKKLKKIDEQVRHMTSLLDDVLTMGKSEVDTINLNPIEIHLNEFCKKIAEEVEHSTKNTHKVMLSVAAEQDTVMADEKLMRNILINLLSNAIKFSPGKGKVLFDAIYQHNTLTFIVKDWGMGIAKEDQPNVFEAFHRSSNVGTIQGTGLGLAIVKKAVSIHGGNIEMESEIDEGTSFKVTIPLK